MSFTGLLGLVVLGIIDWNSFALHHWARVLVGGLLMACGFFALWGYLTLGAHASRGLGGDLVTTGPYRYSRNPQYVGTIPAVLGYAIICNSILALITALLVSGWFVLVPFAEESWCREHLGAAYEEYAANVPRFIGLRGLRDGVLRTPDPFSQSPSRRPTSPTTCSRSRLPPPRPCRHQRRSARGRPASVRRATHRARRGRRGEEPARASKRGRGIPPAVRGSRAWPPRHGTSGGVTCPKQSS